MLGQAKICFILSNGSDEESPVYCHSEEQRDEESDCAYYEILHFVQNDK